MNSAEYQAAYYQRRRQDPAFIEAKRLHGAARRKDPSYKAAQLVRFSKLRADNRAYLDAVKLGRGCADCGYNAHPVALDFDHVRGVKLGCVGSMASMGASRARLNAEIAKCEVRCSNCHRIKTAERLLQSAKN